MNELSRIGNTRIRRIEDAYYILSGRNCYEVNEIGAIIVNAVGKNLTMDEVCDKLASIYEFNDKDTINRDANEFIKFLLCEKIIEIHSNENS
jgi:hypothetical protein